MRRIPAAVLCAVTAMSAASFFQAQTDADAARAAVIARAKSFELDTPYVPPPGDPLDHHAAGFAKIM